MNSYRAEDNSIINPRQGGGGDSWSVNQMFVGKQTVQYKVHWDNVDRLQAIECLNLLSVFLRRTLEWKTKYDIDPHAGRMV